MPVRSSSMPAQTRFGFMKALPSTPAFRPFLSLGILFAFAMPLARPSDAAPFVFQPAASMNVARAIHTATLLADGRVLVAGGQNDNAFAIDSAELYDPVIDSWTNTGPLVSGRKYHTATSLPNGLV